MFITSWLVWRIRRENMRFFKYKKWMYRESAAHPRDRKEIES